MNLCTCTDTPQLSPLCICNREAASVQALKAARRAFLLDATANRWLATFSERLGGVPSALILAGRGDEVVAEARRVTMGGAA